MFPSQLGVHEAFWKEPAPNDPFILMNVFVLLASVSFFIAKWAFKTFKYENELFVLILLVAAVIGIVLAIRIDAFSAVYLFYTTISFTLATKFFDK